MSYNMKYVNLDKDLVVFIRDKLLKKTGSNEYYIYIYIYISLSMLVLNSRD